MKDPVARTASPYTDPSVKGPRSQQLLHAGQLSSTARKSKTKSFSLSLFSLHFYLFVIPSLDTDIVALVS